MFQKMQEAAAIKWEKRSVISLNFPYSGKKRFEMAKNCVIYTYR
jgi:hypothetical protein